MSENPGPASPGREDGEDQQHPPVDTGTGPNEADLGNEGVGTGAEDPEEEGRFDAG